MREKEYNGWTNYETWLVKLWLDNEESTYKFVRALTEIHKTPNELADALKEYVEENIPSLSTLSTVEAATKAHPVPDSGMYSDLLNAALSEVNWFEIAEAYVADFKEETK